MSEVAYSVFQLTQSDNAETRTEAHTHTPTGFRTSDRIARTIHYAWLFPFAFGSVSDNTLPVQPIHDS
jgi:hypothetical protein